MSSSQPGRRSGRGNGGPNRSRSSRHGGGARRGNGRSQQSNGGRHNVRTNSGGNVQKTDEVGVQKSVFSGKIDSRLTTTLLGDLNCLYALS